MHLWARYYQGLGSAGWPWGVALHKVRQIGLPKLQYRSQGCLVATEAIRDKGGLKVDPWTILGWEIVTLVGLFIALILSAIIKGGD